MDKKMDLDVKVTKEMEILMKDFAAKRKPKGRPSKRPPFQDIVYLSVVNGWSEERIAKYYGVKPNTLRVWRYLARNEMY